MAKFCKNCGAALSEGARFCKGCGAKIGGIAGQARNDVGVGGIPPVGDAPLQPQYPPPQYQQPAIQQQPPYQQPPQQPQYQQPAIQQQPPYQQQPQQPQYRQPAQPQPARAAAQTAQRFAGYASQMAGMAFDAPAMGGEIVLGQSGGGAVLGALGGVSSALKYINPFKTLLSGFGNLFKCLGSAFKPRNFFRLLLSLLMAAIWLAPLVFPDWRLNPDNAPWLSWLTFAQGGMQGVGEGFLGDLFGKGLTAGFVIGFLTSPIKTCKSLGGGLGKMFSGANFKTPGPLLLGVGLALIGYNFMAGAASMSGTMAGIAALAATLRSLSSRAGFLRSLFGGVFAKNKRANTQAAGACMAGMAMGFALSVPLSAMPWAYAPYILGAGLSVMGLILAIALGNKGMSNVQ